MEKSTGMVTRLTRLGDTSLIVHWCTAEHGWIKTVAKGARSPKSRFAGKLDLFFDAEIDWVRARRSELHALRDVALSTTRNSLRTDWTAFTAAAYFVQLLERAVEPDHPVPELHDLLRRAIDHLAENNASKRAVEHFESELARLLGVGCGRRPAAMTLGEALGGLPRGRDELLGQLRI
jgi:DNA repair protein RecO (recombination protein O)